MATRRSPSLSARARRWYLGGHGAAAVGHPALGVVSRGAPRTAPEETPVSGASGILAEGASPGLDPERARRLADTLPYVRTAIDALKHKVVRAEREILPIDPSRPYDKQAQADLTFLLENPNPRGDSWRVFAELVVEDYCVIGQGGWEYVKNWRGFPLALYPFDARYMHVRTGWDGSNLNGPRYDWKAPGRQVVPLRNDEITLLLDSPATHRVAGWSRLAVLKQVLESDAAADTYIRSLLQKYLPPGWLHLGEGSTAKQVKDVTNRLQQDVLGRAGMLVTGALKEPKFLPLWQGTSRENELRDWKEYFGRTVAIVYGLQPINLGFTDTVNKATGQVSADLASEDGAISLLLLMEEAWNREVTAKRGGPEQLNLALRFKDITLAERMKRVEMVSKLSGGFPTKMLNELRELADDPPVVGGNAFFVVTKDGPIPFLPQDKDAEQVRDELARQEDDEAQAGEQPHDDDTVEDLTPSKPKPTGGTTQQPEGPDSTNTPPDDQDQAAQKAFVETLVRAYLRVATGSVDWAGRLDRAQAADLRRFVRGQLLARAEEASDPGDLAQTLHLARYRTRLDRALLTPTPPADQPAYRHLAACVRAA